MNESVAKGLRWSLAITTPVGAAVAYLLYMANGIAAGDMIGIAGQEQNIANAQRYAGAWLSLYWILQLGVAASTFLVLRIGKDATPLVRYLGRAFLSVLFSFPITLFAGAILVGALDLVRYLR